MALLAILSFGSYYNFFLSTQIQKHEFFHYYLGAKYSPELGYHGIYRCSMAADFEQGFQERDPLFRVTDLRDNETRMFWAVAPRSPRCDGLDLVLVLSLFAAIGWAFGFEAACVAAIAWGANPNTGYRWIGDAFLRNVWLWSAMLGLCLLRKGKPGGAGALLTLSSLLRIFPALFVFGYALRQLRLWLRDRTLEAGFCRFLVSSLVTALALGTLAVAAAGRGPGVYLEFSRRLAVQVDFVPDNGFG